MDNLHVQQPQEPTPKPKPEGNRSLRFKVERGIVEPKFIQGIPKRVELIRIGRIESAEHERLHLTVSRKRCRCRIRMMRDGIADFRLVNLSYPSDDVADSTGV